ncbi:hypothetical protein VE25_13460 [Devosia geojensis]|uniref:ABC transmembrane type-1 domain-containing protein n=1 Tax=Devosia geojensis TaxID=443610 RepID=A0A0F5FR26_9HYPH|nr:carbohydrate ABC transporter permease [Devosia geojensis]KKB11316.1 hypothetical protein VE25_13460 [Devosia geojensis]
MTIAPSVEMFDLRRRSAQVAGYVVMAGSLIVLQFPLAWLLATAFKSRGEVFSVPPTWIPREPTLEPFAYAFSPIMLRFFFNSVVIAAATAFTSTLIGACTAYVVARLRHWSSNMLMVFFLCSLAFPLPLLMITLYLTLSRLGLIDTYFAVIIGHVVLTLPVVIWLLKGFVDSLPVEVEEAAYVEGASLFRIIWSIVIPIMRPGFTAAAIYVFVTSWNEFIFGLTFTTSSSMRPLPAGIALLFLQEFQYQWPQMMAVATTATVPILVLFLAFQKHFVEGVTVGAVKG